MQHLSEDVYSWSVFSEEKQLDFNGLYLACAAGPVVIDPPPPSDADVQEMERLGPPRHIVLTNADHRRAAPEVRDRFGASLWIHAGDAPLVDCPVDATFTDGDVLAEALQILHVPNGKTPGESAVYWGARKILILGDAIIGRPAGGLGMLPPQKFADPDAAFAGLQRLGALDVDALLLGDGASILTGGGEVLRAFLART